MAGVARRERLQKILASAGVASRRGCEDLIRSGRVRVNGRVAVLGERADPSLDDVRLDGEPVHAVERAYWLLYKPRGVLSTARDPQRRTTVLDLLPRQGERLFPVGRLDRDTRGLLLITNDGPWAHALLHPSHQVEREYVVEVRGAVRDATVRKLERGILLEGQRTAPARVSKLEGVGAGTRSRFHLTLIEGRKRQIRKVCDALGHRVVDLLRIRMGPLRLSNLQEGEARVLTPREERALASLVTRQRSATGKESAASPPTGRSRGVSSKASNRPPD